MLPHSKSFKGFLWIMLMMIDLIVSFFLKSFETKPSKTINSMTIHSDIVINYRLSLYWLFFCAIRLDLYNDRWRIVSEHLCNCHCCCTYSGYSRIFHKRQHFRICLIGSSPNVPLHATAHAFDRISFTVKLGGINNLHTILLG